MTVKFFHVRDFDFDGKILPGGATYAFRELEPGKIEYAVAYCNRKDNFNKRIGRIKSEGRLKSERYRKIFEGDKNTFIQAIERYYSG